MRAKEFLSRYRTADDMVEMLSREIDQIESRTTGSPPMDGQPHGSGTSDKVGRAATKAADVQVKLEAWMTEQLRVKMEIIEVLGAIERRELFEVLQLRYIEPKPADRWENIAEVMDRSVRQVQRLHGEALQAVEAILDE